MSADVGPPGSAAPSARMAGSAGPGNWGASSARGPDWRTWIFQESSAGAAVCSLKEWGPEEIFRRPFDRVILALNGVCGLPSESI